MDSRNVSLIVEDLSPPSATISNSTTTTPRTTSPSQTTAASELVHAHMLNLSLSPSSNDDNNTRNFNNNGASISQQPQQPITFVFERFCPGGLSKSVSLNSPLPSPRPNYQTEDNNSNMVMMNTDIMEVTNYINNINNSNNNNHNHISGNIISSNNNNISNVTTTAAKNNNSIHNTNVVTQTNDKRNKKNNKRKQVSSSSTTSSISSSSCRLPINIDSPVSLNSSNREDDSKSESEYDDNMDICRSEVCSEYDMEESAVEGLKRLLMKFTAMTPTRLQSILSILLDNDIDDADILLLIDNEQFLHTLRGKNGSEISRGNCLLLWHGIQEYRNYYYSTTTTLHHTPKSFSSSCSSITSSSSASSISSSSSYYSPPPSSSASSFSSMLSSSSPSSSRAIVNHDLTASRLLNPPKSKRPKLDHHHHHHHHHINERDEFRHNNNNNNNDDDNNNRSNINIIGGSNVSNNNSISRNTNRSLSSSKSSSSSSSSHIIMPSIYVNKQRVKAPKLSMSTIEEIHTRVDCVLSVVTSENEHRRQIALARNPNSKPTLKFENFVAELKQSHRIPVAFGTLRDMRFAYMLKKLDRQHYEQVLASNKSNVTEFYRASQEVCENLFSDEQLESALPWLELKAKMYYK